MPEIITEAGSASGSVRLHEFPVLEVGNLSFPNGRYAVGFEPGSDETSFAITHRVEHAGLISDLISDRLIKFVCTVSSPASSYRASHVSEIASHVIRWDENDLGEPPLFTPMVVVSEYFKRTLDQDRHGVHKLWHGQEINFKPGMRLAVGSVVQLRSSVLNLLSFHENGELGNGEFQVKSETQEGFRFRVELASDLHRFLKFRIGHSSRAHIITHIVSACFNLLKSKYADDDDENGGWRSYRGLCALSDLLESKRLPHWSHGDDFIPELVATKLYPHKVVEGDNEE